MRWRRICSSAGWRMCVLCMLCSAALRCAVRRWGDVWISTHRRGPPCKPRLTISPLPHPPTPTNSRTRPRRWRRCVAAALAPSPGACLPARTPPTTTSRAKTSYSIGAAAACGERSPTGCGGPAAAACRATPSPLGPGSQSPGRPSSLPARRYDPVFQVKTVDGRTVWRRRHYRVKRDARPATFRFSVRGGRGRGRAALRRGLPCAGDAATRTCHAPPHPSCRCWITG